MPNLGELQAGDIVPCLRPPYSEGTAFVSDIQKYIRPYKVYVALLTQSGTDNPTALVLENTIGNIVWSYSDIGDYIGTLSNSFVIGKTYAMAANYVSGINVFVIDNTTINTINIQSLDLSGNNTNGILNSTPIEIRVYYSEPA